MGIQFGILTVSDRSASGEREDVSGPAIERVIKENGWRVKVSEIVPDVQEAIEERLVAWCDAKNIDVILTTGGTGFAVRDVTPEATLTVVNRLTPGLSEVMRAESIKSTKHGMLSRAVAGIRDRTLIINLPGSPKGAVENLESILPVLEHAVAILRGDSKAEKTH